MRPVANDKTIFFRRRQMIMDEPWMGGTQSPSVIQKIIPTGHYGTKIPYSTHVPPIIILIKMNNRRSGYLGKCANQFFRFKCRAIITN